MSFNNFLNEMKDTEEDVFNYLLPLKCKKGKTVAEYSADLYKYIERRVKAVAYDDGYLVFRASNDSAKSILDQLNFIDMDMDTPYDIDKKWRTDIEIGEQVKYDFSMPGINGDLSEIDVFFSKNIPADQRKKLIITDARSYSDNSFRIKTLCAIETVDVFKKLEKEFDKAREEKILAMIRAEKLKKQEAERELNKDKGFVSWLKKAFF